MQFLAFRFEQWNIYVFAFLILFLGLGSPEDRESEIASWSISEKHKDVIRGAFAGGSRRRMFCV
jgi:hypothetical protein